MVTEYAYPVLGGVSEHVHFLSRELASLGHEVRVVTSGAPAGLRARAAQMDREAADVHGYETVRIGRSIPVVSNGSIARLSAGVGLGRHLAAAIGGMDVVHAQGLATLTLPLAAIRASRAPATIGTFHTYFDGGHWAYRIARRPVDALLQRLDRRIAVSAACVDALSPYFPGRYDIVPNGIDCDLFHRLDASEDHVAGAPRILFVGRFDARNGLHDLLDAAALLHTQGHEFILQIVGDGPTRRGYRRRARRLGIADRVEWHGPMKDGRARLYREATLLAAPCTIASFGVILLEAMASGIPIVCADNIGFRQVIRNGAPGLFVAPSDPVALARGIGTVLAEPGLRSRWGEAGRELARSRYAWPQVARTIERIYLETLAVGAGPPAFTREPAIVGAR